MIELISEPAFWASIALLIGLEVVLGADNAIFVSLLAARVPEAHRERVLRIGLALAAIFRLALLAGVVWTLGLSRPAFEVFGWAPSWRDLVLLAGGVFLIYKSVSELHALVEGEKARPGDHEPKPEIAPMLAILQIVVLNAVFSVDSIVTAIGVTPYVEAMAIAVVASVIVLYFVATRASRFIENHPSVEALALGFLLLVGMLLLARGTGMQVIEPYLYGGFALAAGILALIKLSRHLRQPRPMPHTAEEPKLEPVVETPAKEAPAVAPVEEITVVEEQPVEDIPATEPVTEEAGAEDDVEDSRAEEDAPAVAVVETNVGLGGTAPAVSQSRPLRTQAKRKIRRRQRPKKRREP